MPARAPWSEVEEVDFFALSRRLRLGAGKTLEQGAALMTEDSFHFTHYKLDAYRVARELADLVMVIQRQVPQGHSKMVDQIVRAATGAEALIAEGANRYTPKQKRQRFVEARGEAGEVAAHLERLRRYRFMTEQQLIQGLTLADRLCAMLTGLIKRHSR